MVIYHSAPLLLSLKQSVAGNDAPDHGHDPLFRLPAGRCSFSYPLFGGRLLAGKGRQRPRRHNFGHRQARWKNRTDQALRGHSSCLRESAWRCCAAANNLMVLSVGRRSRGIAHLPRANRPSRCASDCRAGGFSRHPNESLPWLSCCRHMPKAWDDGMRVLACLGASMPGREKRIMGRSKSIN